MDETYNVGILLNRSGFAQVAKLWAFRLAVGASAFNRAVELLKGDYWYIQFFCELF